MTDTHHDHLPPLTSAQPENFSMPDITLGYPLDDGYLDPAESAAPIVNLDRAKALITIPEVWEILRLPGYPCTSCSSPFRDDRSASFSIYDEGRRFKDFGNNDGGDVVDFVALARKTDLSSAARFVIDLAREKQNGIRSVPRHSEARPIESERSDRPQPPQLHLGTEDEIQELAERRNLTIEGLKAATVAGILRFGICCSYPSWFVLDQSRLCIEARRLDGDEFAGSGNLPARKAHTLKGSAKSWPVGMDVVGANEEERVIIVTEGGPDLLAAYDLCQSLGRQGCKPVSFLGRGAATRIHPRALSGFAGRRVRIFPHADKDGGGISAAISWARQIAEKGATVDYLDLGEAFHALCPWVKDLNDLIAVYRGQTKRLSLLLP